MFPILYENVTIGVVPQHHGLGVLSDCISCEVEQERNGIYELAMEYPSSGLHAEELAVRRILKVKPNFTDDPQLFRISRIGKTMNGKFTVYAKHISYDLSGFEITGGTASSAAAACTLMQNKANGFTITTDKTVSATFKIDSPASVKSFFVGKEGSFLDVYGTADIKYDNFNVRFLTNGGADRGVTIRYGKNLLELSQEMGENNLYTHVRCYWKQEDTVVVGPQVPTGLTLDVPKCLLVDVSTEYQSKPSITTLTTRAVKYKNDNNLTVPSNNIKLDFVQSGELANRVDLCDTVSVYYEALGITRTQVKCIRTKWDCIKEKYIETEFGDAVSTAVDTFVANNMKLVNTPSTSFMAEAIARATELITGNLGGNVVIHKNSEGRPFEILIMDTDDINTAVKLWRWGLGGFGYSKTGYDGPYGTAITMNGAIVADYIATGTLDASKISVQHLSASSIDTGTMSANRIKAGVLEDTQGNSSIDMTNGLATLNNLKAKNGLYLVDANGTTRGYLAYNSVGGTSFGQYNQNGILNAVISSATGDGGQLRLYNPSGTQVVNAKAGQSGGGWISIYNSLGTTIATLQHGNNNDGAFTIKNSSGSNTIYGNGQTGGLTCVTLYQTSSRKVKENIKPIADAEKILDLEAVSFDYKEKATGTDKRGFIAEDVAKVLPNLVTPETEDAPACLDYIGMIPYLQDVIKKQEARIQALEERLDALESK